MELTQKSVKNIQEEVYSLGREAWLAGLGVISAAREEGGKLVDEVIKGSKDLVRKGEKLEKEGKSYSEKLQKDLAGKAEEAARFVEKRFDAALEIVGLSSKSKVRELSEKVDHLTNSVAALTRKLESAPKPAAKSTAKM